MWRLLGFSATEGVVNLWRTRLLNLLSIGTIMFAMFVVGSFIFVGMNLKKLTVDWQKQIQFNVFIKDSAGQDELTALKKQLEGSELVESQSFLSKEEAKVQFEHDFNSYKESLEIVGSNPFPASFQVALKQGVEKAAFQDFKHELAKNPMVEEIYYDEEILQRLDFFANLIHVGGWFFGVVMLLSSIFSISNVLKLTFYTKRDEIDIMKLVGASRGYIRGPFIIEGILQGMIGCSLGLLVVLIGHLLLQYYLKTHPDLLFEGLDLQFLPMSWVIALLFSGGFAGLAGSIFSLHQFLKEHISYQ